MPLLKLTSVSYYAQQNFLNRAPKSSMRFTRILAASPLLSRPGARCHIGQQTVLRMSSNDAAARSAAATAPTPWKVNLLYDSDCPLCLKEVRFLQKRDTAGAIKCTDLAAADYDESSAANGNIGFEEGMRYIHAVTREGEVSMRNTVIIMMLFQHGRHASKYCCFKPDSQCGCHNHCPMYTHACMPKHRC
jgi:predicted DCC family thiol-disulfide oxidoreductase YuxK